MLQLMVEYSLTSSTEYGTEIQHIAREVNDNLIFESVLSYFKQF